MRGLYVWGGVGRGKTHLVDLFFRAPRLDSKLRLHFHRFMQLVHEELNALSVREDPLRVVAARIAERARLLCLDEFYVSDITDAMILDRLLAGLFENGVTLVATSNIEPSRLYADGLQRERFLPAIALIESNTRVIGLDGDTDYRLRTLGRARTWYAPLGPRADEGLAECFRALAPDHVVDGAALTILGRTVPVVRHGGGVAWFEFEALCGGPRSVADYIEIARDFHTVVLGGVPVLDDGRRDPVRRFIHLVDEFYDRNVNLVVAAETSPDGLYRGRRLTEPFQRTLSRLVEMQVVGLSRAPSPSVTSRCRQVRARKGRRACLVGRRRSLASRAVRSPRFPRCSPRLAGVRSVEFVSGSPVQVAPVRSELILARPER